MIMSTIKHALTAVALAASAVGSANAFVISGGDLKITIDGFDIANVGYSPTAGVKCLNDTAACDAASTGLPGMGSVDTAGILSVGSITNAAGTIAYFTRGVDGYLTGVFGGLLDRRVETLCNDDGECTTSIRSVGGFFKLYQNATQYDPTLGPAAAGVDLLAGIYPGITGGSLYLSGEFVSGVRVGDTVTTYRTSYSNDTLAGAGQGFLDVTGGTAADLFGKADALTDLNGVKRDLFMDATYNDANGEASRFGWTVGVTGSLKGAAIPEPGALALIALGLLGAGAATRRKA